MKNRIKQRANRKLKAQEEYDEEYLLIYSDNLDESYAEGDYDEEYFEEESSEEFTDMIDMIHQLKQLKKQLRLLIQQQ